MDAEVRTRAKRFHRAENPSPFELTPRDLTILAHVAKHRFLTSSQIARLDGGSEQNVLRCLRALFDHRFLDRPAAQLAHLPVSGPRPFVYALGKAGARLLRQRGHEISASVDWTEKNKRAGSIFLQHTLGVADVMTNLELACRTRDDVALLGEHEVLALAPPHTKAAREPLRWSVSKTILGRKETCSVVADGLFGLEFVDGTAAYFLLELDRGGIPISRTDRPGTNAWRKSIAYKLAVYWEGWRAGQHERQFGLKQLRVLFITSSRERVEHMIKVVGELTEGKGTGFFLFAEQETLRASDPLQAAWLNGRGDRLRLED